MDIFLGVKKLLLVENLNVGKFSNNHYYTENTDQKNTFL